MKDHKKREKLTTEHLRALSDNNFHLTVRAIEVGRRQLLAGKELHLSDIFDEMLEEESDRKEALLDAAAEAAEAADA